MKSEGHFHTIKVNFQKPPQKENHAEVNFSQLARAASLLVQKHRAPFYMIASG